MNLNWPVQVSALKKFMGGAFWADSKKTSMCFTGVFDAKLLLGSRHGKRYLVLSG